MRFIKHFALEGKHAFLSASKYHWIRYDEDKIARSYLSAMAAARGTELHEFAANAIRLGVKLQGRNTIAMYVNDAIGFSMEPEVVLAYSDNAFGTADAISFRKNTLRIHDLKTGESPANMDQLMIYVALFCLEYKIRPSDIRIELRIYQNDAIIVHIPELDDIAHIIDKMITADKIINRIKEEALA